MTHINIGAPLKTSRIGLALGGGAARGWAHLGVLQALDEAGIRPAFVAGTSIGAVVAAAWASGRADELRQEVLELDWRTLLSFLDVGIPRSGLIEGRGIENLLRRFISPVDIRDLPLPFAAIATNLGTGERVVIADGPVMDAVRASISVPGLFAPVRRNGDLLVDGGLVDPVPVSAVREMGADFVIAVDVTDALMDDRPYLSSHSAAPDGRVPGMAEVILTSLAISEVALARLAQARDPADLRICPDVGHIRFLDFLKGREAIEAGYLATRMVLPTILENG